MAKRTPIKAIRAKCLECSCGSSMEVRMCQVTECPLYEYRFGHRPKKEDDLGEESEYDEEIEENRIDS